MEKTELFKFFVNNSERVMNDETKVENNYENYQKGLAEMDTCLCFTADNDTAVIMLNNRTFTMHRKIECVQVPKDSEYTIPMVNEFIKKHTTLGTFDDFAFEYPKEKESETNDLIEKKETKKQTKWNS
jgi:hypothetical protein